MSTHGPRKKLRILLVDDHALVCDGLRAVLSREPDCEVVGEARDGRAAVERALALRPDIIIMDVEMPQMSGAEAARIIHTSLPAKIVILSGHDTMANVQALMAAGAEAFVSKQAAREELITAIRTIMNGEMYVSGNLTSAVLRDYAARLTPTADARVMQLSPREREILALIGAGCSNYEIAEKLGIGITTVFTHRERLQEKLGTNNIVDLIKIAICSGLTSIFPSTHE